MLSDFKIAPSVSREWTVQSAGGKDLEGHPCGPGHVPLRAWRLRSAGLDRLPGKRAPPPEFLVQAWAGRTVDMSNLFLDEANAAG